MMTRDERGNDEEQPRGDTCNARDCPAREEQRGTDDVDEVPAQLQLIVQRREGETCGEGVAFYEGGHTYKGLFSRGLMEGPGVFTWSHGLKYEGEFVCNTPMGRGTYTWPDGSSYSGDVCYGIRHGRGTYICAKGSVSYKGQWAQGKRHGKGTVYYNHSRSSWYKGLWVRNHREGWGVRCYSSGNVYCGEWRNSRRHGQGTMRWLKLGQQYTGEWMDGVQHGRGTHVWTLQGSNWGLYSQNNEYTGQFVQGQRHGQGTFSYAGGAVYEGEWKNNKKHGKGKFTFEDGRVCEAEFVDDQMVTPTVHMSRAPNPLCGASALSHHDSCTSNMGLNIERLLDNVPERKRNTERKQVEFVVLWQNTQLRSIYSFYSGLGRSHTSRLSHLQLWRLLKDCKIHHHGMSLTQMDRWIKEDETTEIHSPFTAMLLCRFISCLVIVAYNIYSRDLASAENLLAACLSKLLTDDILPNAKTVKGFLFRQPDLSEVSTTYAKRGWQIYQAYCRVNATKEDRTMTYRHLMWMFRDLQLLDNNLTAAKLLEIINVESPDSNNLSSCLDHEITFLEFFEVLLGCAEVKCQQVSEDLEEGEGETNGTLLKVRNCSSQSISVPANSPNSPEILRHKSTETSRSVDTAESPLAHHVGSQQTLENMDEQDKDIQNRRMKTKQTEQEVWAQTVQQFFNHVFFPAFEHYESVNRYLEENPPVQSFINSTTKT